MRMLQASFDKYATDYDSHFTHTTIGMAQRNRVHYFSSKYLTNSKSVLEINCGTGEDVLWLSNRCKQVVATDASSEMIALAQNKLQRKEITNATIVQSAFTQLTFKLGGAKFDLLFSNFGGLNCVSQTEMNQLTSCFHDLLQTKGKMILVLMSSNCWIEKIYFKLKGEKEKSQRRKNKMGVSTTINESTFLTYYYSPKELIKLFGDKFTMIELRPIGFFIPPSYLEKMMVTKPTLAKILIALENTFANYQWMANRADHYLIVLEKK